MSLDIRQCSISDLEFAPNIAQILAEYAAECSPSIKGLPNPLAKVDLYKHLETINSIHTIGAFLDNTLIGYVIIVNPVLPHYSVRIAVSESYFVLKEYRNTGAGLKLRYAAEKYAKDNGAIGILWSAPLGSILAEILEKTEEYMETNRVFFRSLVDE